MSRRQSEFVTLVARQEGSRCLGRYLSIGSDNLISVVRVFDCVEGGELLKVSQTAVFEYVFEYGRSGRATGMPLFEQTSRMHW